MKDILELRNKVIKLDEKKQKENLIELEKERQKKINAYYEKLRYEEMNPRQINKEQEMRIEDLKNRNIILNERIKFNIYKVNFFCIFMGIGDWGLGIGNCAQSPIPNSQSPIPIPIYN